MFTREGGRGRGSGAKVNRLPDIVEPRYLITELGVGSWRPEPPGGYGGRTWVSLNETYTPCGGFSTAR